MSRIRVLRQIKNLTGITEVPAPHRRKVAGSVADRMRHEHLELNSFAERQLERRLQDRTKIRTETRVSLDCFYLSAANLERKHARGVGYLFRKINLKVADYFAARLAPSLDGRKGRILEHLPAFVEDVVERLVTPFIEDLFVHRYFASGVFRVPTLVG